VARGAALTAGNKEGRRRRADTEKQREQPEVEDEWESAKDLFVICKNFKGLKVKLNFPLIQGSNGEMTKMKVVQLFKLYNFALGFDFKNSKYASLF
jgi:hypothetical protein